MTAEDDILRGLFGQGVALAHSDPRIASFNVHPGERKYVEGAVESRKREFHAARACARTAMERLGEPQVEIPSSPDRSPVWPGHLIGSISHCAMLCMAVVARKGEWHEAIGVDVEPAHGLPGELLDAICSPTERADLATKPVDEQLLLARILFSAKEAVYKCQYPLTGTMLEFRDLEITISERSFQARLKRPAGRFGIGTVFDGRYAFAHGCIVTGATVPAARPDSGSA